MRAIGFGLNGVRGDYVPHEFVPAFVIATAGGLSSFPRDVAEMAMAWVIRDKVEAAYRRGDLG
jgi:hypothetical protein